MRVRSRTWGHVWGGRGKRGEKKKRNIVRKVTSVSLIERHI